MGGRTARERQWRALALQVLVTAALVLSCSLPLGPVVSLHAATNSRVRDPKAENSCPDCRVQAERLRSVAGDLVKKATFQDLNKAVEQLQESTRLFQQVHSSRDAAENYLKIGDIFGISGRYRQQTSIYDQALKLAGDSEITLRCLILSHQTLAFLDMDLDQSRKLSKEAFEKSKHTPDPSARAEALEAYGRVLMYTELERAFEMLRSAIQLFHQAKNVDGEARAQLFAGYALFHLKNSYEEALSAFNKALQLWTSVNNAHGVALAHRARGLYWYSTGEPQKASKEYDLAEPVFHTLHDRKFEAIISDARGDVSAEVGNYEESLRYHQQAYLDFSQIGDVQGEMAALDGSAHAQWVLNRPEMSQQLNEVKLRRARELHLYRYEASALAGIADFHVLHGDFIKAEPLYQQALVLFRKEDEPIQQANILIRLGRLYSKRADDEQALSAFREALNITEKKKQIAQSAAAHFEIATIDQRRNRLQDARGEIEKTLAIIESQRIKIFDFDDRASYFASVHEYYQFYIDTLMQLDRQNPGREFARKALEASEKSKVRSLLDMLSVASSVPLPLSEIQKQIRGDHAVILEYALGKNHSYLWVIDENHVTSYSLSVPTSDLSRMCGQFLDSLMANGPHLTETPQQRQDREARAARYLYDEQKLSEVLLRPAFNSLRGKKIIIVPDRFLQYVPFAALLPSRESELIILPSASALKVLRDKAQRRKPPVGKVVVFADPVFEKDDKRVTGNSSSENKDTAPEIAKQVARDVLGSSYIPRLPSSYYEAKAIAKIYGDKARIKQSFDANRQTALSILSLYRFIHLATHEFLDTHHPELSGLVLSMVDKNGGGQDGYLRLRDIYSLKLSAELVVLSACQSALGRDLESEGMIGLTRAFFYAGSSRVISTLWKVNDRATAALMSYFYQRLHNGQSPSVALRGAQSDLAQIPEYKHPYYWAAFVLQGEYRWSNKNR